MASSLLSRVRALALAALAAASAALGGCRDAASPPAVPLASASHVLTVLAGSDLRDMEPLLGMVRDATGVELRMTYAATMDAAEKIAAGEKYDAAWVSSNRYAMLIPQAKSRVLRAHSTMLSSIALGLRESKARELGWGPDHEPTWPQIAKAASEGRFSFAMSDPSVTNTGFSALLGLATELSGKGADMGPSDIDAKALASFFKAHKLTSGASGGLIDAFVAEQDKVDGLVNYAASLATLNASGRLRERLSIIYPRDGVATADYPLMLLSAAKREDFERVEAYVLSKGFQEAMSDLTLRRPFNPEAIVSPQAPPVGVAELPFPKRLDVVDAILTAFVEELRRPTDSTFVVDVSGSMHGGRIAALRQALLGLTGEDATEGGRFTKFRERERVTLIPFDKKPEQSSTYDMGVGAAHKSAMNGLTERVGTLDAPSGHTGTAIYDAAKAAYMDAADRRRDDPDRFYSIVLMTDGENNTGIDGAAFAQWYAELPPVDKGIKIFAVQFGEAASSDLKVLTDATGGRLFDSRKGSLASIFKDIRGYQ